MARPSNSLPPYNPQLAQLVQEPPEGDGWIHEIKLDGYRIGGAIERGQVRLFSRRNLEWTAYRQRWEAEIAQMRRVLACLPMKEECKWGKPTYTVDGKNVVTIQGL